MGSLFSPGKLRNDKNVRLGYLTQLGAMFIEACVTEPVLDVVDRNFGVVLPLLVEWNVYDIDYPDPCVDQGIDLRHIHECCFDESGSDAWVDVHAKTGSQFIKALDLARRPQNLGDLDNSLVGHSRTIPGNDLVGGQGGFDGVLFADDIEDIVLPKVQILYNRLERGNECVEVLLIGDSGREAFRDKFAR